jgi:hypothetical protein
LVFVRIMKMSNIAAGPPRAEGQPSISVRNLVLAASLALVIVPLGSVAIEAASITCGFGSNYYYSGGCGTGTNEDTKVFDWGAYSLELTFLDLADDFFISIDDVPMSQSTFDERSAGLGDYDCVPVVDPTQTSEPCRDFVISAPSRLDESGSPRWSGYIIDIQWLHNSDIDYPNEPDPDGTGPLPGQVRLLQNPGAVEGNEYTIDMCLAAAAGVPGFVDCTYTPPPPDAPIDPGIRSGDTAFSSVTPGFTETPATVPEPSSILLLGAGFGGILLRRRRRA